jgi:hypothetical protein
VGVDDAATQSGVNHLLPDGLQRQRARLVGVVTQVQLFQRTHRQPHKLLLARGRTVSVPVVLLRMLPVRRDQLGDRNRVRLVRCAG